MVTQRETLTTNRPYPPPSNVITILQRIRSRNLPDRVGSEYLRDARIPEGTITRTLFGLRFLGLIGQTDEPTPDLRSVATSTDEEYRSTLERLVRQGYSEVFASVDPAQDAPDRIVNFFRRYTPASQRGRMVTFFLGMCREAGIPTLEVSREASPRRAGAVPSGRSATVRGESQPRRSRARQTAQGSSHGVERTRQRDGTLSPALDMLLRSLPPAGAGLSTTQREHWIEMARATLAFLYPSQESRQEGEDEEA
jgi:hypothetical protein